MHEPANWLTVYSPWSAQVTLALDFVLEHYYKCLEYQVLTAHEDEYILVGH